ncbi:hypothetical protein TrST_g12226 [Triparma strigata]|uniref:Helicase ATP-binding domain-containing protein n=1 Tax=Triparma strigata TaxID=1606541 RepID=A0A9W7C030_9STRA|nr:hypothetical protein TrST_g12226 [Triparma strigata]
MNFMDYLESKNLQSCYEKITTNDADNSSSDWLGTTTNENNDEVDWLSSTKVKSDDDWLSSTSEPSSGSGWLKGEEDKETVDVKKLKEEYIRSHSFLEYLKNNREGLREKVRLGVSQGTSERESSLKILKGRIKGGVEDKRREGVVGGKKVKKVKVDLAEELELSGYDSNEGRGGKGDGANDSDEDSENSDSAAPADEGVTIGGFHFPAPSKAKALAPKDAPINLSSLLQPQNLHGVVPPSLPHLIHAPNQPLSNIHPSTPINAGLPKLFYIARTHSQLSQFTSELKRTRWSSVGVTHLGSRKSLCCNRSINSPNLSEERVTEKCMDLLKTSSSCSFKKETKINDLAFHATSQGSDIEDLCKLGEGTGSCGYYASRKGLAVSRVVCMTYGNFFSEDSRRSLGVDLRGSVVVVDEAHNVPEALRQVANSRVGKEGLERLGKTFKVYFEKYSERLSGKNLEYCRNLTALVSGFTKAVVQMSGENPGKKVRNVNEFLFDCKVDNVNLSKIVRYIERQELCRKLLGFYKKVIEAEQTDTLPTSTSTSTSPPKATPFVNKHISPLSPFLSFLRRLSSSSSNGKIIVEPTCLRYFLIQPSCIFSQITRSAAAVVLAGGTMKPFKFLSSEILENVEGYISGSNIADGRGYDQPITSEGDCTFFSCDHVVSKDNVEMYSVGRDGGGRGFDFRMKGRNREETIDGLGGVVLDGCRGCGRGTVLFLGSYKYEEVVVRRWRKTGLMERLKGAVKVYREPREARDLEAVLRNFSRDASKGALLICVIGGKMSEGINFSNDMARLIIVAGLPYPDVTDEELKTKMKHLDQKKDGITGNEYYFNLCMRAVNQSIGRAIRHAHDYASIWLVDQRYEKEDRVWQALPAWIRKGGGGRGKGFNDIRDGLKGFLEGRRRVYGDGV